MVMVVVKYILNLNGCVYYHRIVSSPDPTPHQGKRGLGTLVEFLGILNVSSHVTITYSDLLAQHARCLPRPNGPLSLICHSQSSAAKQTRALNPSQDLCITSKTRFQRVNLARCFSPLGQKRGYCRMFEQTIEPLCCS